MRPMLAIAVLATALCACIEEFDAPEPAACRLDAPAEVDLGELFVVEVSCSDEPSFVDYDFGDDTNLVRTSAGIREHSYGADAVNHTHWRVQAFVVDQAGEVQRLEAIVERRF